MQERGRSGETGNQFGGLSCIPRDRGVTGVNYDRIRATFLHLNMDLTSVIESEKVVERIQLTTP